MISAVIIVIDARVWFEKDRADARINVVSKRFTNEFEDLGKIGSGGFS